MGNTRKYNNLSKVEFVHHELDEVIDPDFVKELHRMVAYKLFTLWLEERRIGDASQEKKEKLLKNRCLKIGCVKLTKW